MDNRNSDDKQQMELFSRELKKLRRVVADLHDRSHETLEAVNRTGALSREELIFWQFSYCLMHEAMTQWCNGQLELLDAIERGELGDIPEFKIPDKVSDFMKGGGHGNN